MAGRFQLTVPSSKPGFASSTERLWMRGTPAATAGIAVAPTRNVANATSGNSVFFMVVILAYSGTGERRGYFPQTARKTGRAASAQMR